MKIKTIIIITLFFVSSFSGANIFVSEAETLPNEGMETYDLLIEGNVQNEFGYPIGQAKVNFNDGTFDHWTKTNYDGSYQIIISEMSDQINLDFTISRVGYNDYTGSFSVSLVQGSTVTKTIDAEMTKKAGLLVEGYIKGPSGDPMSNVNVQIHNPNNEINYFIGEMNTTSDGYYFIFDAGLSLQKYMIIAKIGNIHYSSYLYQNENYNTTGDYFNENLILYDEGFVVVSGNVRGQTSEIPLILTNANIIVRKNNNIVYNQTVDPWGNFYIPLPVFSGEYDIEYSAIGYQTYYESISASQATHISKSPILDAVATQEDANNFFNGFLSKIKDIGLQFMENVTSATNPELSYTYELSSPFSFKGVGMDINIEILFEYVGDYRVNITMDVDNNFITVNLPPPFHLLQGVLKFGLRASIYDPDQNLTTLNPVLLLDSFEIERGAQFQQEFNTEDLIEFLSGNNDAAREKINILLEQLDNRGVELELLASLTIFVGLKASINTDISVGINETKNFEVNFELEEITFDILATIDIEIAMVAEVEMEIFDDSSYELELVETELTINANTDLTFTLASANYNFDSNTLTLSAVRMEFSGFNLDAYAEWQIGVLSGQINFGSVGTNPTDTGFYFTYDVDFGNNQNSNYAPSDPILSGDTTRYEHETISLTMMSEDPELLNVSYFWKVNSGSETQTAFFDSAVEHTITFNDWNEGTYVVEVRSFDGEKYSNISSITYTIFNSGPDSLDVTVPSSVVVANTFTLSAISDNQVGGNLQYTVTWGDGTQSSDTAAAGELVTFTHSYQNLGEKDINVHVSGEYGSDTVFKSVDITNTPTDTPYAPYGPGSGDKDESLTYRFNTIDGDGHYVKYEIKWGDGSYTETGYYPSGDYVYRSHSYSTDGVRYEIQVRATDGWSGWSSWSSKKYVDIEKPSGGGGFYSLVSGINLMKFEISGESLSSFVDSMFIPFIGFNLTSVAIFVKRRREGIFISHDPRH